jgi:DNA-binding XRE family transcriptional regulator
MIPYGNSWSQKFPPTVTELNSWVFSEYVPQKVIQYLSTSSSQRMTEIGFLLGVTDMVTSTVFTLIARTGDGFIMTVLMPPMEELQPVVPGKAKKLIQEELAERSDLTSKMITMIERDERNPSVNVAHSIARGLGIPLWRLVKDAEDLKLEMNDK